MRYACRTDRNHAEVRDGLRAKGHDVCDLSDIGGGVPDLVVRQPARIPSMVFFEVKDGEKPPSARELTPKQKRWRKYCGEITFTVTTLEEALEVL